MRKAFRFQAGSVMLKPKLSTTGAAGRHRGRIPTLATLAALVSIGLLRNISFAAMEECILKQWNSGEMFRPPSPA